MDVGQGRVNCVWGPSLNLSQHIDVEPDRDKRIYIYVYIYMCISDPSSAAPPPPPPGPALVCGCGLLHPPCGVVWSRWVCLGWHGVGSGFLAVVPLCVFRSAVGVWYILITYDDDDDDDGDDDHHHHR